MLFHRLLLRKRPTHPFPEPSNETFRLLANPDIPFASICRYVDSDVNPIINEARILESRVYVQRGAPVAPHRRIVLRIREKRGACFWLLLDRMPTSKMALIKGIGMTPANDRVSSGLGLRFQQPEQLWLII